MIPKEPLGEYLHFSFSERLKQFLWNIIFPAFPYIRDGLLKFGIIRHGIRQEYHIGWLRPGRELKILKGTCALTDLMRTVLRGWTLAKSWICAAALISGTNIICGSLKTESYGGTTSLRLNINLSDI